jgi:hypothetical protein
MSTTGNSSGDGPPDDIEPIQPDRGRPPRRLWLIGLLSVIIYTAYDVFEWIREQHNSALENRLKNTWFPKAVTKWYVFWVVMSTITGGIWWPWHHRGLATGGILILGCLICLWIERERKTHAEKADHPMPDWHDHFSVRDSYVILPELKEDDGEIKCVTRLQLSSFVPRALIICILIAGCIALSALTNFNWHIKLPPFAVAAVISWYIQASWRRRIVVLTKKRLVSYDDPPWPRDDHNHWWPLDVLSELDTTKPFWAQFLPGKRIGVQIKFEAYGKEKRLPLLEFGEQLFGKMGDAILAAHR